MGPLENSNFEKTTWSCSWHTPNTVWLQNTGPEFETRLRAQSLQTLSKVPLAHISQFKPIERLTQ